MTKELKQEAEEWLRKFLLCNDCKRKCHCIELNAYCEEQVLKAYTDSAEPREKRIGELEDCIKDLQKDCENKTNVIADYTNKLAICNTRIAELEKENAELKTRVENQKSFLERIKAKFNLGKLERKEVEGYLESDQLTKAKDLIRNLLRVTWGESWNYALEWKVKAEEFLKECEE